jgi:hypothetical protein
MIDKTTPIKISTALLKLVPYVIAIASAIAAVTPNHTDDELVLTIKQIANILALNIGHSAVAAADLSSSVCTNKDI